jgi:hypothetical protein
MDVLALSDATFSGSWTLMDVCEAISIDYGSDDREGGTPVSPRRSTDPR